MKNAMKIYNSSPSDKQKYLRLIYLKDKIRLLILANCKINNNLIIEYNNLIGEI